MKAVELVGRTARRLAPVIITTDNIGNPIFDKIGVDHPVLIENVNEKWIKVSPIDKNDSSCIGVTILEVKDYDDDKWVDADYSIPPISEDTIKDIIGSINENNPLEKYANIAPVCKNPSIPSCEKGVEIIDNEDLSVVLRRLNKVFNDFKSKVTFNVYAIDKDTPLNFIHSFTFKELKDGGYSISESPLKMTEPDIIIISGKFNNAMMRLINTGIVDIYCVHEILVGDDLCFTPVTFSDIEDILQENNHTNIYVGNKVYEFSYVNDIYSFSIVDGFDTKNAYILHPSLIKVIDGIPGYRGTDLCHFDY